MGYVNLSLPEGLGLLEAAGRVALAHGQLELMLRMTIKTLSGMTVKDALSATEKTKNWELRAQIEKLFTQKSKDLSLLLKLRALLNRCEALSEKRNRLLHNAWAIGPDGSIVTKGADHAWGEAPTDADLNGLALEIAEQVEELNKARLRGFIKEVIHKFDEKNATPRDSSEHG
jgi:hypothetical protein